MQLNLGIENLCALQVCKTQHAFDQHKRHRLIVCRLTWSTKHQLMTVHCRYGVTEVQLNKLLQTKGFCSVRVRITSIHRLISHGFARLGFELMLLLHSAHASYY
jgi:hypothetical protein